MIRHLGRQIYFPILENQNYFEKRTVLYGYCTKEYKLFKVTSGIPTKHHELRVLKILFDARNRHHCSVQISVRQNDYVLTNKFEIREILSWDVILSRKLIFPSMYENIGKIFGWNAIGILPIMPGHINERNAIKISVFCTK